MPKCGAYFRLKGFERFAEPSLGREAPFAGNALESLTNADPTPNAAAPTIVLDLTKFLRFMLSPKKGYIDTIYYTTTVSPGTAIAYLPAAFGITGGSASQPNLVGMREISELRAVSHSMI